MTASGSSQTSVRSASPTRPLSQRPGNAPCYRSWHDQGVSERRGGYAPRVRGRHRRLRCGLFRARHVRPVPRPTRSSSIWNSYEGSTAMHVGGRSSARWYTYARSSTPCSSQKGWRRKRKREHCARSGTRSRRLASCQVSKISWWAKNLNNGSGGSLSLDSHRGTIGPGMRGSATSLALDLIEGAIGAGE